MVTETEVHYRQPCYDSARMAQRKYSTSPTPETVSSAADAMLKLSTCAGPAQHQSGYMIDGSAVVYPEMRGGGSSGALYNNNNSNSNSSNSQEYTGAHIPTSPSSPRVRSNSFSRVSRKEREFVPDYRKDDQYWMKRQKNNEAAKRSREKRRLNDMMMSEKLKIVVDEKMAVQKELDAIKRHFGLPLDQPFVGDEDTHSSDISRTYSSTIALASITTTSTSSCSPAPGVFAEAKTERRNSSTQPPPLQPVPDSPPPTKSTYLNTKCQEYHQEENYCNNIYNHNYSSGMDRQQEQHQNQCSPVAQQHYQIQQHHYDSSHSPSHSMGYSNTSSQSPHSSLSSPQNLQIVLSPGPSNDTDIPASPLNLCKRRRITLNDEESSMSQQQYPYSHHNSHQSIQQDGFRLTPRADERKSIPHKLRYKNYSNEICMTDQTDAMLMDQNSTSPIQSSNNGISVNTINHLSAANEDQSMDQSECTSEITYSSENPESNYINMYSPRSEQDEESDSKYLDRRERNNLAARKCRENRRLINELRIVKSQVLENENTKLKDELKSLSDEVHGLKRLIEQKHQAKAAGEHFEPPPHDQTVENNTQENDHSGY